MIFCAGNRFGKKSRELIEIFRFSTFTTNRRRVPGPSPVTGELRLFEIVGGQTIYIIGVRLSFLFIYYYYFSFA